MQHPLVPATPAPTQGLASHRPPLLHHCALTYPPCPGFVLILVHNYVDIRASQDVSLGKTLIACTHPPVLQHGDGAPWAPSQPWAQPSLCNNAFVQIFSSESWRSHSASIGVPRLNRVNSYIKFQYLGR